VTETFGSKTNRLQRLILALVIAFVSLVPQVTPTLAQSGERSLYLYYTHTRETARIVFKRNGQYVQSGLNELNQFLRDWRRNEPAKMDPALFDLVWEVYQEVGGREPINIVSAYRSPATNAMLAANSSGVADNSQHMRGTAMDFFIPGVPLNRLRAAAMKKQIGGVGYYPNSGSPFVHLDTGNVRAWPRMTRAQLQDIFPDGKTMHLPTDGKPLSQQGYKLAQAEWQRCHRVPCGGGSTQVADGGAGSGRTLMDVIFGGNGGDDTAVPARTEVAVAAAPAAPVAPSAPRSAPVPAMRTAMLETAEVAPQAGPAAVPFATSGSAPLEPELATASLAPMPAMKSETLLVATAPRETEPVTGETAVMALAALGAPVPAPRLHMSDPPTTNEEFVSAYAAPLTGNVQAQQALATIIAGSGQPAPTPAPAAQPLQLAALPTTANAGSAPANPVASLFSGTFGALGAQAPNALVSALSSFVGPAAEDVAPREVALVAPDLDHVVETMIQPAALDSAAFAVIFEHDVADFDPTPELGQALVPLLGAPEPSALSAGQFTRPRSLEVASRS
jgi:uncharacterized protein YcbK (DUF882 family)